MKKIVIPLIIVMLLAGCGHQENRETYALLDQFVHETDTPDSQVYLVSHTQPIQYFLKPQGSLTEAYGAVKDHRSPLTGKSFKKVVSEQAFTEICQQQGKKIYFNPLKANQFGIHLIDAPLPKKATEGTTPYQLASNAASKDYVITTSKPFFLKNYAIACIFYAAETQKATTRSLALYQKINGKWTKTYDFRLEKW
ncbi:hypothetical protein [Echinicola vietnamensis]|nr:hypothetical protein [Echinicola vietnamensis]